MFQIVRCFFSPTEGFLLIEYSHDHSRGVISDFSFFFWGGGGGRDGLASEASLISRKGGGVLFAVRRPPREHFFILSYFMCFWSHMSKVF